MSDFVIIGSFQVQAQLLSTSMRLDIFFYIFSRKDSLKLLIECLIQLINHWLSIIYRLQDCGIDISLSTVEPDANNHQNIKFFFFSYEKLK